MKKSIQLLATVVFLLTISFGTFAEVKPDVNNLTVKLNKGVMEFKYNNSTSEKVVIEILNVNGQLMHKETINNHQSFSKSINFDELRDGQYKLKLSSDKKRHSKEIWIYKNAEIAFLKQGYQSYKLLYGNKSAMDVSVQFLNEFGEIVMEDAFTSKNGFAKTYQVSKRKTNAKTLRMITAAGVNDFLLK